MTDLLNSEIPLEPIAEILVETTSSAHKVEVFRLGPLTQHPNADLLMLSRVFDGYTVVVGKNHWKEGDLAAYVVPDSLVPLAREEFSFLASPGHPNRTHHKVAVKRLRGIYSEGLLVPAPQGSSVGDDVAALLGVTHYEPPEKGSSSGIKGPSVIAGDQESPPSGNIPKYDLESWKRYGSCLKGLEIVATEKCHGACLKVTFRHDRLYVGSKNTWKKSTPTNIYWDAANSVPGIEQFLRANPGLVLYGEVYGQVQDLTYGVTRGVRFVAFDLWKPDNLDTPGCYFNHDTFQTLMAAYSIPAAPVLARGHLNRETLLGLAEGLTVLGNGHCIREGVVVRPLQEQYGHFGRMVLKIVGNGYYERK